MPRRFAQAVNRFARFLSFGSFLLAYVGLTSDAFGLLPALNSLNTILLIVALGGLWLLHEDIEGTSTSGSDETGQDMSSSTDSNVESDGGIQFSPRVRELRDEAPSGFGAFGGITAGGSVGAPMGPVGIVIGGIVGGLLGHEVEYRHLVSRYHDAIGETAKTVLRQESGVHAPPPYRVLDVREESEDEQYLVRIEDAEEVEHRIRLDLDARSYTYEGLVE